MKFLTGKLLVHITNELWNNEQNIAPFYEGIYSVSINGYSAATFIPEFERKNDLWYLDTLEDLDNIISCDEARLDTATIEERSITPCLERAGSIETFSTKISPEYFNPLNKDNLNHHTVYYVTPKEFHTFRGELATVAEKTIGVHNYIELEELKDFEFVKFILTNIVTTEKLEKIKSIT